MTRNGDAADDVEIRLRDVEDADLPVFFAHQSDPEATAIAAFTARDREAFLAHWARIRSDPAVVTRTILRAGDVAGNIVSFEQDGAREVGYWIGREYWGRGIATRALAKFLMIVRERPLHAWITKDNTASIRVVERCGFTLLREDGGSLVFELR